MGTQMEMKRVLEQVEAELTAMVIAGAVGTVTVHCGAGDLLVEVTTKRKHKPVRLGRDRLLAIVEAK